QQEQEVRDRARVLEKTFAEFGFKVKVVEIETGPVISQYEIELEAGLRLAKITNLADDLAIALRVPSVRIVAPIPGKNSVGIEVPNTTRQMVRLREVIEETQSKSRSMKIPIFLGKDVAGNPMVMDMATMPHLLIAGRTGTGKSVCLNSIIVSMLMTRRPDEVRMLMIDPKMVELTPYKSLPHLMHPVVTDMRKAEAILAWAVEKMEQRYTLLAKAGVRHLTQYNALGRDEILRRIKPETEDEAAAIPTTMPFIVMIADEIADMMMTAGKEIEAHIIRLAQKSRAVGIHLVLATQKPTVDVITGLIKSNLPARIAFQVASRTDSRVVLDEMGAERLLGNGDMLFLSPGTSQILRGQGTFVSDDEIGRVMGTVGTSEPQYAAELVNLQPAGSEADAKATGSGKDKDELYEAAVEVIIREGRGSVSLLQRALGVGYGRGARLIDFMAEDGIVGEYKGSQAREVLMTMEEWAARNGSEPLPPDPPPRKLKIQPHADDAAVEADEEGAGDEEADDSWDEESQEWAEESGDWEDEADDDSGDDAEEDSEEEDDSEDEYEEYDEEYEEDEEEDASAERG
ncbi:MAG: DNA translocase FtsK, partial [Planctomycetota bacterium]|nr:DNA translocase FtsK [Planctomycetota bacterium]